MPGVVFVTAGQAAQKRTLRFDPTDANVTAGQAAQKSMSEPPHMPSIVTAGQAAQKRPRGQLS